MQKETSSSTKWKNADSFEEETKVQVREVYKRIRWECLSSWLEDKNYV